MGALFGGLSALFIGFSDLFGRRVMGASSATTAAVTMQFVAIFSSFASMLVVASAFGWRDIIIGALSGLGMGTGLAMYYGGIARSSSTVVAPLVGVMSAVIPYGYTLITGARPSATAIAGAIVAFGGLVLITAGKAKGRAAFVRTGLMWGFASGLGYGFGLSVIIEASSDSGAWPAVSQRLIAFLLMVVVARGISAPVIAPAGVRVSAVTAGILAGLTTIFYLIGVQADAPPAVVTASMFPAASVAIGKIFYGDPVTRLQALGIGIVLLGVAGVVGG
ncbi:MAG: DMT family transporter [Acidimicrobiia bacterium]|nr:DMT family transporter [Acidimicrobiia bacterium]MDH5420305.1 DMT family transporter [Acidimicrobiia bacterium]